MNANWMWLLPNLARLPNLGSLGVVRITDANTALVTRITALTQLTRLEIDWRQMTNIPATLTTHLSHLTNLLELESSAGSDHTASLSLGIGALRKLTLLHFAVRLPQDGYYAEHPFSIAPIARVSTQMHDTASVIRELLQPLSRLVCLKLVCMLTSSDACILAQVLPSSLRNLSLRVGFLWDGLSSTVPVPLPHEDQSQPAADALAPFLARLQQLSFSLLTQEAWAAFTPKLSACVCLEDLVLEGPNEIRQGGESLRLGMLLSTLTGITSLVLKQALDPAAAGLDIPHLGMLTTLQCLAIPSWRLPLGFDGGEDRAAAEVLIRNVNLLPLSELLMLRQCQIHSMQRMRGGGTSAAAFEKKLHELQWAAGIPLAEVADPEVYNPEIAGHGRPSGRAFLRVARWARYLQELQSTICMLLAYAVATCTMGSLFAIVLACKLLRHN